jgi:hypothetical protein
MSAIIRSMLVALVLVGTASAANAKPEYTIYVDTSHHGVTDSGNLTPCVETDQNGR